MSEKIEDGADVPIPDRALLERALKAFEFAENNSTPNALGRGLSDDQIKELAEGARWALLVIIAAAQDAPVAAQVPADVRRLVIAARVVAFESQSKEALKELDAASEAFADRVPWENQP